MIDSQAVKNTCNAGIESKGFCHYKCTNGIKRHLAVDTLGFPFFTHCTAANVSDDQGLIEMLTNNQDYFRAKPVNIPKITILLDNGYHPAKITLAMQVVYPQIMTKIEFSSCMVKSSFKIFDQTLATFHPSIGTFNHPASRYWNKSSLTSC